MIWDANQAYSADNLLKGAKATLGVDYHSRAGDGKKVAGRTYTAKFFHDISADRRQYFLFSYNDADFEGTGIDSTLDSGTIAYGQVWQSAAVSGMAVSLGAFWAHTANDYGQSLVNDTYVINNSAGLVGGVVQAIPLSVKDTLFVGSNLVLSYHDKWVATAYPYAGLKHQLTPAIKASARLTAAASTGDASLGEDAFLFSPSVGIVYTADGYAFGAKYKYEKFTNHRGSRVGFTVSKSF